MKIKQILNCYTNKKNRGFILKTAIGTILIVFLIFLTLNQSLEASFSWIDKQIFNQVEQHDLDSNNPTDMNNKVQKITHIYRKKDRANEKFNNEVEHSFSIAQHQNTCKRFSSGEVYYYLNEKRQSTGLNYLTSNFKLELATTNHSKYLTTKTYKYHHKHNISPHNEDSTINGFTGVTNYERAWKEGYYSKFLGEGISYRTTPIKSIDDLFTAIYHRFTLLDNRFNEIGLSYLELENGCTLNLVHNPGNSTLNELCQFPQEIVVGEYYKGICKDKNFLIAKTLYQNALKEVALNNPQYVLWPPENYSEFQTIFKGEHPDPLPDINHWTGNPISIEFNRYYYKNLIELISFKLFINPYTEDEQEIKNTRLLTHATDPHKLFNTYQFALFPLNVLKKNTFYKVDFMYKYDEVEYLISWDFKTQ